MSTDFRDAAKRHMADAESLKENSWANADHLFGVAAECALKRVMVSLGMKIHPDGNIKDLGHKLHMPYLWPAFQSFAQGRLASRYLQPLSSDNLFSDWAIEQRYSHRATISQSQADDHHLAASQCMAAMEMAFLDGGLS
jgi:hypothetical protein